MFSSEPFGFILSMLGALLVLEGIPYFGFPKAVKGWAVFLQGLPEKRMRTIGLVIMVAGILLLLAIRDIRP